MLLVYDRARPNQQSSLWSGYLAQPRNCGVEDRSIWMWERRHCGQMWGGYCRTNESRGDLDVVTRSAVEQASRQLPQYDRPT